MLERKIINDLKAWKNKPARKCLVVKGARQVGKTFIIEKFCRENYKNFIRINFDESPEYTEIFSRNLDVETIIKRMSASIPNIRLVPNETVIFLDEIQNCPRARTALKFLTIDGRFDVIASGSLLGINLKKVPSFPVGQVEHLEMHSLDFEEFCWANGMNKDGLAYVKELYDKKEQVPESVHTNMMDLFREYIIVGGMPAAVSLFVDTHNFAEVLKVQRGILQDYADDIAKYAESTEKVKARACFHSIPKQLAKDYKKFQYSVVEKGGTARKYAGSLHWLFDAGIINFCYNLSSPELPLEGNSKNDEFKVYMRDTGLLMAMLEDGSQADIIKGNLGIYKGAVYENIVADVFTKSSKKLYYYGIPNIIEIDFFIRQEGIAVGIEVKAADNTKSKSLTNLIGHYGVSKGIRLSSKNIGVHNKIENLPLYLVMYL